MKRGLGSIAAGLGVLVGTMLVVFGVLAIAGFARPVAGETLDLAPWLKVELVAGGIAAIAAGWLCRRLACCLWPPLALAAIVLLLGLVEAAELLVAAGVKDVNAPTPLVLAAPAVGTVGVLIGAFLLARSSTAMR
ncbi:MAG: hypothetical protein HKO59_02030 [Phycisphaerales bacterium]|nr:hypothetical protein [Phycisphaerales bacterium]NNM24760.1 hypothetical protein [Phycisphaerales bacterium]